MTHTSTIPGNPLLSRRELLQRTGMGVGGLALTGLLDEGASSAHLAAPHFHPRAKRVIHLFMNGGPSHVDTFDPKPALAKYAGKQLPVHYKTERKTGVALPSPFKFNRCGESGLEISELFPNLSKCADDICVIRSMHANVPNHEPSLMLMNCGDDRAPRPSVGAWVSYGLGSANADLPTFIVLIPGGYPVLGPANWRSSFLPASYQGVYVDTKIQDLKRIIPFLRNQNQSLVDQRHQLDFVNAINRLHLDRRQQDSELEARIKTFELAYRMQSRATDAFDINQEPQSIRDLYGDSDYGRQLIMARRLVERGVRFVQVYSGNFQPWDNHSQIEKNHRRLARRHDQPIAALLGDLKNRGLLDDTLIVWGGEFGRTPTTEGDQGRDHNHYGFSVWLAGGGVKGGMHYGATDEFGWRAADNRVEIHDLHATILHLLGIDHTRLTFRSSGRDFRLTDVSGIVLSNILA